MTIHTCKPAQHPSPNGRGAALDLPALAPAATAWAPFGRETLRYTSDDTRPVARVPGGWA